MSSRAPIQIDSELKEQFDKMKASGSASDYLQILMKYKAQEKNHLLLDDAVRDDVSSLKSKLGISSVNDVLRLLLMSFNKADQMPKEVFDYFLTLRKGY
jgi:hypothetical protein